MTVGSGIEIEDLGARPIVIGGGPAGLGVALRLAPALPVLFEGDVRCGGLSKTHEQDGCRVDFGPHIVHAKRKDILDFIRSLVPGDLIERHVKLQILWNGKFVPYPIRGLRALMVLEPWTAVRASIEFVAARFVQKILKGERDVTFKAWIVRRFGRTLYETYFRPYAEKVWKITANEISSYVARQRVPSPSIRDFARRLMKIRPTRFHKEDQDFVKAYYPRLGIGQVIDGLEKKVRESGVAIRCGAQVQAIHLEGGRIARIDYEQQGRRSVTTSGPVFSTIPLNVLVEAIRPAPPPDVMSAAAGLDYSAERFLYLVINRAVVLEAALTYFNDPKIKFNRAYSLRLLSESCVPPGCEVMCLEFTCAPNDDQWKEPDESLYLHAVETFESLGLVKRGEIRGHFFTRATHAYPRFRVGFEKRLSLILKYLESIDGLFVLGRQALFCYANVDEVLGMAFDTVDWLHSHPGQTLRYTEIFGEYLHCLEEN